MSKEALFFSDRIEDAARELEERGAHILHTFGDVALVVTLPEGVDPSSLENATADAPSSLDGGAKYMIDAWRATQELDRR